MPVAGARDSRVGVDVTLSEDWTSPLRSLRYLEAFLNSTVIGFAYFEDGVVRDCNDAIARLLYTTPDRLIGLDISSEALAGASRRALPRPVPRLGAGSRSGFGRSAARRSSPAL